MREATFVEREADPEVAGVPAIAEAGGRAAQPASRRARSSPTSTIDVNWGFALFGTNVMAERRRWSGRLSGWTQLQRLGGTRLGVWAIKHVVARLQLSLHRHTGGRLSLTGRAPVLLLTTTGRRTGERRTVPVFYLRDGDRYVVCNVRPPYERTNPWVLNVLANPQVRLTLHGETVDGRAHRADESEVDRYWPALVRLWPAYRSFQDAGGDLSIFVVEPAAARPRSPDRDARSTLAPRR